MELICTGHCAPNGLIWKLKVHCFAFREEGTYLCRFHTEQNLATKWISLHRRTNSSNEWKIQWNETMLFSFLFVTTLRNILFMTSVHFSNSCNRNLTNGIRKPPTYGSQRICYNNLWQYFDRKILHRERERKANNFYRQIDVKCMSGTRERYFSSLYIVERLSSHLHWKSNVDSLTMHSNSYRYLREGYRSFPAFCTQWL